MINNKRVTEHALVLGSIFNLFILLLAHWIMVRFFGIGSNMAWVISMFLMVIFECDEFMYFHWDRRKQGD